MSIKTLTKQQKKNISRGVKKYYRTPEGKARREAGAGMPQGKPWAAGNTPWNKGTKGVVKHTATSRRKLSRASSKPVYQFEMWTLKFIKKWPSGTKAAQSLGLNPTSISLCANRRIKSSGGFRWAFSREAFSPENFSWEDFYKE